MVHLLWTTRLEIVKALLKQEKNPNNVALSPKIRKSPLFLVVDSNFSHSKQPFLKIIHMWIKPLLTFSEKNLKSMSTGLSILPARCCRIIRQSFKGE